MEELSPAVQINILYKRLTAVEKRADSLNKEVHNIKQEIIVLKNKISEEAGSKTESVEEKAQTRKTKKTILLDYIPEPANKKPCLDVTDTSGYNFSSENGYVVAYTDGACENNGSPKAKAGIGVWFGQNHPLNVSKPVVGRATNNTAEIQACIEALSVLKKQGIDSVKIITDSKFTINCITNWMVKWKQNNWKTTAGHPVINKEDLQQLDSLIHTFQDVQWQHVNGHQGIHGNEEADRLARAGAARYKK